jgi:hypothetical protein
MNDDQEKSDHRKVSQLRYTHGFRYAFRRCPKTLDSNLLGGDGLQHGVGRAPAARGSGLTSPARSDRIVAVLRRSFAEWLGGDTPLLERLRPWRALAMVGLLTLGCATSPEMKLQHEMVTEMFYDAARECEGRFHSLHLGAAGDRDADPHLRPLEAAVADPPPGEPDLVGRPLPQRRWR